GGAGQTGNTTWVNSPGFDESSGRAAADYIHRRPQAKDEDRSPAPGPRRAGEPRAARAGPVGRPRPTSDSRKQGEGMKRTAGVMVLVAGLAGCVNDQPGPYMSNYWGGQSGQCGTTCGGSRPGPTVPNCQGPWGQPVAMAAPYTSEPPQGEAAARAMLNNSLPLNAVQQASYNPSADNPSAI